MKAGKNDRICHRLFQTIKKAALAIPLQESYDVCVGENKGKRKQPVEGKRNEASPQHDVTLLSSPANRKEQQQPPTWTPDLICLESVCLSRRLRSANLR